MNPITQLQQCLESYANPKTKVRWESYLCEPKRVEQFLYDHLDDLSLEGLRYAVEKFPSDRKARLIQRWKAGE